MAVGNDGGALLFHRFFILSMLNVRIQQIQSVSQNSLAFKVNHKLSAESTGFIRQKRFSDVNKNNSECCILFPNYVRYNNIMLRNVLPHLKRCTVYTGVLSEECSRRKWNYCKRGYTSISRSLQGSNHLYCRYFTSHACL